MTHWRWLGPFALLLIWTTTAVTAQAWDPFHKPNPHVEEGNAALAAGDPEQALKAYDEAARELPDRAEVHLARGIAMLRSSKHDQAREALMRAAQPPAPEGVRADAYYNLGLAFYRAGDAVAEAKDAGAAQAQFRQAADAFRRSLRLRPGHADAAYNLELAQQRIQEQEKQKQQQKQQEKDQDESKQSSGNRDESQKKDGKEGENEPETSGDDQQKQQQKQRDTARQRSDDERRRQAESEPGSESETRRDRTPRQQQQKAAADREKGEGKPLPSHVRKTLDALRNQEKSLQLHRSHRRGLRRQKPEKDW